MHIAVEGCSHGELDIIYKTIQRLEELNNFKLDLLLCCGDFQSVRNERDLKCMAVPTKYMQMQDFHRYYSGEKVAPVLTIFIGGNHEASNYLQELPYGGWVAPNIYYLGYAGVIQVGDIRIGGLSGIYKGADYLKGHFEKTPYTGSTMRSVYHIRNLEVFRLKQLSGDTKIFMSHDWPRGIYHYGNIPELLRYKKHFKDEIANNTLGSRPAEDLIKKIKPDYWFSGHLHVKFPAILPHEGSNGEKKLTKFLALDKCLPRREFLQVLKLPTSTSPLELKHDAEWLTILRLTNHLLNTKSNTVYMPGPGSLERYNFTPTPEELEETISLMGGDLTIPASNFVKTAQPFNGNRLPNMNSVSMPQQPLSNPQTTTLCSLLGINDPLGQILRPVVNPRKCSSESKGNLSRSFNSSFCGPFNKSEMNITMNSLQTTTDSFNQSSNPEEVALSDSEEIEFSKDEETGDIIMEIPILSSSSSSLSSSSKENKLNISPIRRNSLLSLSQETFSSPVASSPRVTGEDGLRRGLSLSKIKNSDLDLSALEVSASEKILSPSTSLLGSSSPPSSLSPPQTASSQSEEEGDLTDRSGSAKRGSEDDDSLQFPTEEGRKSKKFKRRNNSIYSTGEDQL